MADCEKNGVQCENISLYDGEYRCKKCFEKFVKLSEVKLAHSQDVCWRNHPNITCGCPVCKQNDTLSILAAIKENDDE